MKYHYTLIKLIVGKIIIFLLSSITTLRNQMQSISDYSKKIPEPMGFIIKINQLKSISLCIILFLLHSCNSFHKDQNGCIDDTIKIAKEQLLYSNKIISDALVQNEEDEYVSPRSVSNLKNVIIKMQSRKVVTALSCTIAERDQNKLIIHSNLVNL